MFREYSLVESKLVKKKKEREEVGGGFFMVFYTTAFLFLINTRPACVSDWRESDQQINLTGSVL